MPLKINGAGANSENIFIKQVLFNDSTHENTEINKIIFKASENAEGVGKWLRQLNITPLTQGSAYIDYSTVNVVITERDQTNDYIKVKYDDGRPNGQDSINLIVGNEQVVGIEENVPKYDYDGDHVHQLYYGDQITISADAKKGYAAPTIKPVRGGSHGVSEDIALDEYITHSGEIISVTAPVIEFLNQQNINTGYSTDGGPYRVLVTNPNNFACVLQYNFFAKASASLTIPDKDPDRYYGDDYNTQTVELQPGEDYVITYNDSLSKNYYYQFSCRFLYGFAASASTFNNIPRYDGGVSTMTTSTGSWNMGYGATMDITIRESDLVESQNLQWVWTISGEGVHIATDVEFWESNKIRVYSDNIYGSSPVWYSYITATASSSGGVVEQLVKKITVGTESSNDGSGDSGSGSGSSGSGDTYCVSYDTNILLPNNKTKLAKDIRTDDIVCAYNSEHELVPTKIINVYKSYEATKLFVITLENGDVIKVTNNHPILTDNGYKNIGGVSGYEKLNMNDKLYTVSGLYNMESIDVIPNIDPVYNFYTEYDNFIADNVIVACENPDNFVVGLNCFLEYEGVDPGNVFNSGTAMSSTTGTKITISVVKTCVSPNTDILMADLSTKHAKDIKIGDMIMSTDERGCLIADKVKNIYVSNQCDHLYEVYTENRCVLSVSGSHPLLTKNGYRNIEGVCGYEKLDITDEVYTIEGYRKLVMIKCIPNTERVYNFYNKYDNFIANGVIVACENPDNFIEGVNCFTDPETGVSDKWNPGNGGGFEDGGGIGGGGGLPPIDNGGTETGGY